MAGSHHAPSPGLVTKTRAAVVLTVLVVALAIIGLYSATHRSSTSAAKGAAKSISVTKASGSSRSPASAGPSSTPAGAPATTPSTTTPPTTAPSATTTGSTAAALAPLTYVVQPGDNLTIIAAWFHMHGYGQLYDANKAVIGADPDLIHPGQHITISSGGMTTSH